MIDELILPSVFFPFFLITVFHLLPVLKNQEEKVEIHEYRPCLYAEHSSQPPLALMEF